MWRISAGFNAFLAPTHPGRLLERYRRRREDRRNKRGISPYFASAVDAAKTSHKIREIFFLARKKSSLMWCGKGSWILILWSIKIALSVLFCSDAVAVWPRFIFKPPFFKGKWKKKSVFFFWAKYASHQVVSEREGRGAKKTQPPTF